MDGLYGVSAAERTEIALPAGYKGGRLTLTSGTPVTTSDVTAATTLYYTPCPFASNEIAFPTSSRGGGRWFRRQFTEAKMLLTGLSNATPYDVFAEPSGGNISIYVGPAWTSGTARAVDLSYVDAVPVHRGNERAVYLGTIYTSAAGQCDDSATKRFVMNWNNAVRKILFTCPGYANDAAATSYTKTAGNFSQANGGTGSTFAYVSNGHTAIEGVVAALGNMAGAGYFRFGVGVDSTTTTEWVGQSQITTSNHTIAFPFGKVLSAGYHALDLLVNAVTTTATIFADTDRNGASADPYSTYVEAYVYV